MAAFGLGQRRVRVWTYSDAGMSRVQCRWDEEAFQPGLGPGRNCAQGIPRQGPVRGPGPRTTGPGHRDQADQALTTSVIVRWPHKISASEHPPAHQLMQRLRCLGLH